MPKSSATSRSLGKRGWTYIGGTEWVVGATRRYRKITVTIHIARASPKPDRFMRQEDDGGRGRGVYLAVEDFSPMFAFYQSFSRRFSINRDFYQTRYSFTKCGG